jgi:hypothetical protein
MPELAPGAVALLGSGETAPACGPIYDLLAARARTPLHVAILETPAGFQPNSARVAGKVAEHLQVRLQNARPQIALLPARRRGTAHSPDDPAASAGLRGADMIFLGPGSPTYAADQLRGSLAWERAVARQRQGASIVTASAATIALGRLALPIYEIYKVGAPLHWQEGLDLFGPYGLDLAIVPHWNNAEGGADLDTSRCFMGLERYEQLLKMLPAGISVLGIDEHTGLVLDLAAGRCLVIGRGGVSIWRDGAERRHERKAEFAIDELGPFKLPALAAGIAPAIWEEMAPVEEPDVPPAVPDQISLLIEERQAARTRRDWAAADALRAQIAALGWEVRDTPAGQVAAPLA